jgi:hypothetical protein
VAECEMYGSSKFHWERTNTDVNGTAWSSVALVEWDAVRRKFNTEPNSFRLRRVQSSRTASPTEPCFHLGGTSVGEKADHRWRSEGVTHGML